MPDDDAGYQHVSPEAMLREDHTFKPTPQAGSDAYRKGMCKTCHEIEHRAGGTECVDCYELRMNTNMGFPLMETPPHGNHTE